jgi:LDH2 family malate/lactate/ureidoglycolate dehydrogenase
MRPEREVTPAEAAEHGDDHVLVGAADLAAFVREVGQHCGLPDDHVDLFVDGVLSGDLRGLPSHGVFRLGIYARGFLTGAINARPELREYGTSPGSRLMDADNALGLISGQLAMDRAIELAREQGIGAVSVRNSNHAGVLAIHVLRAAEAGMIGFFTSNAPALMAPWGASDALLSNSPFAYAFPTGRDPIVVDMACSAVARGRIRLAATAGHPIPAGWALDASGEETNDAIAAMDGVVLPMAAHKGSGLAVAHEILSACLSGARLSKDVPRGFLRHGADTLDSWDVGHLAVAIDIGATRPVADFIADVDDLSAAMRSLPPRPGFERVRLPGEPEEECVTRFRASGVPIAPTTFSSLLDLAAELGLASALTPITPEVPND